MTIDLTKINGWKEDVPQVLIHKGQELFWIDCEECP